jgi:hypothetical protein
VKNKFFGHCYHAGTFHPVFRLRYAQQSGIMKKNVFVFLLLFLGALCFAKGQRDSFELGVGYHRMTETQEDSGIKLTMPSLAINFAGTTFYTKNIGIAAYGNFLLPQELKVSAQGLSFIIDKSAYNFLFGMDFLIGPAFMLYQNESFCLPLSIGMNYCHLWSVVSVVDTSSSEIGLGANITGEYHVNPTVYIYGRFQLSLGLYSWGTASGYTEDGVASISGSGSSITWGMEPCIGIGFQW